ncbi:MAG: tetratricopeptide repeat protein, partial [Syntrophobacteria bacterium]
MRREILICLFLVLATLTVYWQVGNYEFVNFDDDKYIIENFHVQKGLTRDSVIWAFTATHVSNWHPLTWLSHMLDFQLYGLNPSGHHLTNVFFHLVNTLLLFLVLKLMTGALWRSGLVAALFAVHPLHVESVVWVAERKDVLSTLFWMLTLWAYLGYTKRPGVKRYLVILLAFALGLMAKPMLVTLPFVLLLLDYWPLKRIELGQSAIGLPAASQPSTIANKPGAQAFRLLLEKTPMFVLAAVSSVVTFIVQKSGGAVGALETYPFKIRMANALLSYVIYLKKMIWPQNLAVFYPHPGQSLPMWQAAGAGLLLVVVSIAVIRAGRRYPYLPVGWLWYVGTLVPVIGLVQVGDQAMADRYTYVSLIGLFIVVAWGVPDVARSWRYGKSALALATGSLLVALMVSTSLQLKHWKNSLTLFDHALSVTENNYLAHLNFGAALADQERTEEAITHYHRSLQIAPNYAKAYNNLGLALAQQGKNDEATAHYLKALQLNPDYARAHNNLGVVLTRTGEFEKAIAHYYEALTLEPDWVEVYNNLANAFLTQGKFDQAIFYYSEILRIKPNYAEAHNNMAITLASRGRFLEASVHYSEALRLKPSSAEINNNLAVALFNLGKVQGAIAHYTKAIELSPNYSEAHNNLGNALLQQGKLSQAVSSFERALEIRPAYAEAHNNLGVALARQGRLNEAIVHFSESVRLEPNYAQARANLELALQEAGK